MELIAWHGITFYFLKQFLTLNIADNTIPLPKVLSDPLLLPMLITMSKNKDYSPNYFFKVSKLYFLSDRITSGKREDRICKWENGSL